MIIDSSSPCLAMALPSSIFNKRVSNSVFLSRKTLLASPTVDRTAQANINGQQHRCGNREIGRLFHGTLDEEAHVFTKNFLITSYQIGFNQKASMRAIMNILQDTSLSHHKANPEVQAYGFGLTEEMVKRDLVWISFRTNVFVNSYPSWDDIVQVQSVASWGGQNFFLVEWLVRNHDTREVLIRASGQFLLMNAKTRRFQKITDQIREEMKPNISDNHDPIITNHDIRVKLPQFDVNSAHETQSGLVADWGDLDPNKHVNHAKYIEWVLKSVPRSVFESHELSELTIDFKKECGIDCVVQSLTTIVHGGHMESEPQHLEMHHLLRFQSGFDIVMRARTAWRPK